MKNKILLTTEKFKKMKSIRIIVGIVIATTLLIGACKKNGTGGEAIVVAMPAHHGKMIKGATVFIKFKATEKPTDPTKEFDLKIVGDPTEDHVHIEGLLPGNYFFYAMGIDSTLIAPNNVVKGGVPLTIKYSERKSEIDLDIPVTED
jgi:hypothetical protein